MARCAPSRVTGFGRERARCRRRHRRVEPSRRRARIRSYGAGSVGGDAFEGAREGRGERFRADVRGRAGRGAAARTFRRDHGTPCRLDDARSGGSAPRLARRRRPRRKTRAVRRRLGRGRSYAEGEGSCRGSVTPRPRRRGSPSRPVSRRRARPAAARSDDVARPADRHGARGGVAWPAHPTAPAMWNGPRCSTNGGRSAGWSSGRATR